MTNRAITAMSVHASLEDLGYQSCNKHGKKHYVWMGRQDCPKCEALTNPNLLPRSEVMNVEEKSEPAQREASSRERGRDAAGGINRKLTEEQVVEARQMSKRGDSFSTIGRFYGVDRQTAWNAVRGVGRYGDIPGALEKSPVEPTVIREEKKKTVCRGQGCLTKVNGYNLDLRGLCYRCIEVGNKPVETPKGANGRPLNECKNGHNKDEIGQWQGVCAACKKENDRTRAKKHAEEEGRTYQPRSSYLVLGALAGLIAKHDVTLRELDAAVGIPNRSLAGYAYHAVTCHPERAQKIADYFGVTVDELTHVPV